MTVKQEVSTFSTSIYLKDCLAVEKEGMSKIEASGKEESKQDKANQNHEWYIHTLSLATIFKGLRIISLTR